MELVIRSASLDDILTIQHIACLTWPEAYADILSPGQMQYMQRTMYSEEVLANQMKAEDHRFFIAENGRPIGFAGASPYALDGDQHPNAVYWKLHKLYVLPHLQKTGAGKALLNQVISVAKENGATNLLLNVNRDNKAFDYYQKQGFTVIETGDFDIGAGFFMRDYVMAKKI